MSRIRRIAPGLGRGGLIGNTEGPESYLRELDTLPSQFCRATGGTETVISQGGKFYRVHTFTDADPTSLLLNFDGANGSTTFTDDSGLGHAVTANGDAQISTAQSKFGGSSLALDGNGDFIQTGSALSFGSDQFSVEAWVRFSQNLPYQDSGFNYSANLIGGFDSTNNALEIVFSSGASSGPPTSITVVRANVAAVVSATGLSISLDTWYHVAVTKDASNVVRIFLDGTVVGTPTTDTQAIANIKYNIGSSGNTGYLRYFPGYIDSLRITKGQALYTSAFTPSTTALTRVGSGSLTFTRGGAVEYLVVGGGGGGSNFRSGGGGGGGYRCSVVGESSGGGASAEPRKIVAANPYSVTVGGGGSGGAFSSTGAANTGTSGQSSAFEDISAFGGGYGGNSNAAGGSGGSGGGGGGGLGSYSGGSGESSQGYAGGVNGQYGAGGGGGAGAAGASGVVDDAGNGGDGVQSSIDGTATYRSGGGGGSTFFGGTSPSAGSGGLGGGTAGGNIGASNAAANTGGGGGGGGQSNVSSSGGPGGAGGSGIVIARYRITQAEYEAEAA